VPASDTSITPAAIRRSRTRPSLVALDRWHVIQAAHRSGEHHEALSGVDASAIDTGTGAAAEEQLGWVLSLLGRAESISEWMVRHGENYNQKYAV